MHKYIDHFLRACVVVASGVMIYTCCVLLEREHTALYYIEGKMIYELQQKGSGQYDTVQYESCKPYLSYDKAKADLQKELEDFYASSMPESYYPVVADLEIVEY